MSKRALVTGCCGFIGSNLMRDLVSRGWDVDGVDDLSTGDLEPIIDIGIRPVPADLLHMYDSQDLARKSATLVINGDFTHDEVLKRVRSGMYDVVFHLAANPFIKQSIEYPVETYETNTFKTIGLFDACKNNVRTVVFASSAAVYGNTILLPIRETASTFPLTPYALQKLHCEQFAELSNSLYNTKIVSLRLFNVFGPGQRGDSPYSNLISSWCNNLSKGKSLRIDGTGNQTRDLCYIDNVVDVFRLVAEAEVPSQLSNIYNVGCGVSISNNDILEYIVEKYPSAAVHRAPVREGDINHSQADVARINQELNYKPQVQFYQGLEQTLKWWGL